MRDAFVSSYLSRPTLATTVTIRCECVGIFIWRCVLPVLHCGTCLDISPVVYLVWARTFRRSRQPKSRPVECPESSKVPAGRTPLGKSDLYRGSSGCGFLPWFSPLLTIPGQRKSVCDDFCMPIATYLWSVVRSHRPILVVLRSNIGFFRRSAASTMWPFVLQFLQSEHLNKNWNSVWRQLFRVAAPHEPHSPFELDPSYRPDIGFRPANN